MHGELQPWIHPQLVGRGTLMPRPTKVWLTTELAPRHHQIEIFNLCDARTGDAKNERGGVGEPRLHFRGRGGRCGYAAARPPATGRTRNRHWISSSSTPVHAHPRRSRILIDATFSVAQATTTVSTV